jgi:hypothetical protein
MPRDLAEQFLESLFVFIAIAAAAPGVRLKPPKTKGKSN